MADIFKTIRVSNPSTGPLQESLVGAVNASTGAADAGKVVLLNVSGLIDPSMGGGGGSTIFVNGLAVISPSPNLEDSASVTWSVTVGGGYSNIQATATGGGGGSVTSVFTRTGVVTAQSGDYAAYYDVLGSAATAQTNAEAFTTAALTTYAPLASPAFTGTPTAPTPLTSDNSTKLATTAYVRAQGYVTAATAPVTSVFGRVGAVTAQTSDYSYSQISGTPQLPQTFSPVTNEFLTSYNASTGLFTAAQPTYAGISGTPNLSVYALLAGAVFTGNVTLDAELIDGVGSYGTSGQVLSSTGTSTLWVTGGGSGSTLPAVSSFTWVNQGTSTTSQNKANGPILFQLQDSGGAAYWRLLYTAAPRTPYKLQVQMQGLSFQPVNSQTIGVYFYDGTKFLGIEFVAQGSPTWTTRLLGGTALSGGAYTVYNSFGDTGQAESLQAFTGGPVWIQLRNDGSVLYFDFSYDGFNYVPWVTQNVGTLLTPTSIAFGGLCATEGVIPTVNGYLLAWNVINNANL